ncbi:unnamed protein product, partial [Amoebophrya sp. A25]|eukprot:GSA25T00013802001.1
MRKSKSFSVTGEVTTSSLPKEISIISILSERIANARVKLVPHTTGDRRIYTAPFLILAAATPYCKTRTITYNSEIFSPPAQKLVSKWTRGQDENQDGDQRVPRDPFHNLWLRSFLGAQYPLRSRIKQLRRTRQQLENATFASFPSEVFVVDERADRTPEEIMQDDRDSASPSLYDVSASEIADELEEPSVHPSLLTSGHVASKLLGIPSSFIVTRWHRDIDAKNYILEIDEVSRHHMQTVAWTESVFQVLESAALLMQQLIDGAGGSETRALPSSLSSQ